MANFGDIGLGLMRGGQEGIQTAGSIYGLMRQKARDEQEEGLREIIGEKAGLELQALRDYNTPLKFDEVMQPFRETDKIGTSMAEEIATKGGFLDPTNRTIKKGDLAKVRELSSTPEMMKQRALLNLNDINAQLKTLRPEAPSYSQLTEKKNYLEKMYKLEEDFEAVPVWNEKSSSWEWINKKNGQPVPTLAGKTPKEVQVELLKEEAAAGKAADTEEARNERARLDREAADRRAAEANASRERATAARNTATAATAEEKKTAAEKTRHERVERARKASAFRMAVQLTRQKFGGNSLPFTTDSEGRITITPSQGNEAATTFFESKVTELTAKEINDAIKKGQLPKEYATEEAPSEAALPATAESLDRLLPNTATQMRPQGGIMAESEARTELKAQGYNPTQVESYVKMYKSQGKLK